MSNRSLVIEAHDLTFDQKVIALLMCVAQEKKVEIERAIEGTVQSFLQLKLLHSLAEAPEGRLTVGQLRSLMVERTANVSRTLNKLAELGLIEKVRSTVDQRTVYVSITEAGRVAHEEGDASLLDLSTGLEPGELKQLFDLLVKL
jgi:DNA-binding MarR family transcriptional regulator